MFLFVLFRFVLPKQRGDCPPLKKLCIFRIDKPQQVLQQSGQRNSVRTLWDFKTAYIPKESYQRFQTGAH